MQQNNESYNIPLTSSMTGEYYNYIDHRERHAAGPATMACHPREQRLSPLNHDRQEHTGYLPFQAHFHGPQHARAYLDGRDNSSLDPNDGLEVQELQADPLQYVEQLYMAMVTGTLVKGSN